MHALCIVWLFAGLCVEGHGRGAQASSPARDGQVLHAQALGVVQAEDARAKQPICPKAMSTFEINECYSDENGKTDASYLKLVRLLGALLRPGDEEATKADVKRIPLDGAESAWIAYRDKACTAAGSEYEGGTIRPSIELGCRITVTRHHMDELWALYNDLGTR